MNTRTKALLYRVGALLMIVSCFAFGHDTVAHGIALATVAAAPLHPNVLELFKGAGVNWKPGVDPAAAISLIKEKVTTRMPVEELVAKAFVQPGSATSGLA